MGDHDKLLKDAEDQLNSKANQMGRLKVEFDHNLQKLTESYYPKMRPLLVQVYESQKEQHYLELEISWKTRQLAKMNEEGATFSENLHMREAREAELDKMLPAFDDAIAALEALTPEDMKVLRNYEHPPELVLKAMEATLIVKGEYNTDWEEAKITLMPSYFFGFFIKHAKTYDKDNVDDEVIYKLDPYFVNPDFEPASVAAASVPCGALCKWVRSIYDYCKVKAIVAENGLSADELTPDIDKLQERLDGKQKEIAGAEGRLAALKEEYKTRIKELKTRYDATMDPLQETFFEAHHQYGTVFCSPRRPN